MSMPPDNDQPQGYGPPPGGQPDGYGQPHGYGPPQDQQQGYDQQAPKKPWFKKKRFVIPLGIVVLFVLIGIIPPDFDE